METFWLAPTLWRGLPLKSVKFYHFLGFFCWGGERGGGEPGICDGRMPLSTRQTNTVPPKRCDTPCLAQGRPKLRNICMMVPCRSTDGQRHRTVMPKALRNRSPPSASPPSKESRILRFSAFAKRGACKRTLTGWPRFSSVRLRFVHGTVRAVPVFGSDGSSGERVSRYFSSVLTEIHGSGVGS